MSVPWASKAPIQGQQLRHRFGAVPEQDPAKVAQRVDVQQQVGELNVADHPVDGLALAPRLAVVGPGRKLRQVQHAVGADLELGDGRDADLHFGQQRLEVFVGGGRQLQHGEEARLVALPFVARYQHLVTIAEAHRVVQPATAAAQALAQRHHRAGLEGLEAAPAVGVMHEVVPRSTDFRDREPGRQLARLGAVQLMPSLPSLEAGVNAAPAEVEVVHTGQERMHALAILDQSAPHMGHEARAGGFGEVGQQALAFEHTVAPGLAAIVQHGLDLGRSLHTSERQCLALSTYGGPLG
jgi:hypothetical protein